MTSNLPAWQKFKDYCLFSEENGFALDISRMNFAEGFLDKSLPMFIKAREQMRALEGGAIANPDEQRMVGHYWLRSPKLAPAIELQAQIDSTIMSIKTFAASVHTGQIKTPSGKTFKHLLVIGIGGSALGPQFVSHALANADDPMSAWFFDNTDPDGMERVIASLPDMSSTLVIVISKSGGTKETRNGQLIAKAAWQAAGLEFSKQAVAVTGEDSALDQTAKAEGWLARFPMWDWVGGRNSELSAVGLLPAALQGFDIDGLLSGARAMDEMTRRDELRSNPAGLLSLMWYHACKGHGQKDMVILPYKDRLEFLSRYLQQLVMESLGKELDLDGKPVNQGISVFGNKGSTDQHAYVQQLREGLNNFFAIFISVLKDRVSRRGKSLIDTAAHEVDPGITCGDYLFGFCQGTRQALFEKDRESISITIDEVSEHSIGMLIALFERAVGLYALFTNINAYHQPGVEAGKKAANEILALQGKIMSFLKTNPHPCDCEQIAAGIGQPYAVETIFSILRRLAANKRLKRRAGEHPLQDAYSL